MKNIRNTEVEPRDKKIKCVIKFFRERKDKREPKIVSRNNELKLSKFGKSCKPTNVRNLMNSKVGKTQSHNNFW